MEDWLLVERPFQTTRGGCSLLIFPETQEVLGFPSYVAACFHNRDQVSAAAVRLALRDRGTKDAGHAIEQIDGLLRSRQLLRDNLHPIRRGAPPDDAVLNISVSEFCNLRCPHCYSDSSPFRRGGLSSFDQIIANFVNAFRGHSRIDVAIT